MGKIAIKGHTTRGKEVIETLKMLGGSDVGYGGIGLHYYYYVDEYGNIAGTTKLPESKTYVTYTLEQFLEKFPYKVGDKVSSKYLKNYKIDKMEWEDCNNRVIYKLQGMGWYSAKELQPYKEPMEEQKLIPPYMDYDVRTSKQEPMEENEILNQLIDYFNNTPRDVIEKEWHGYDKYNEVGPTVKEYMQYINSNRKPQYPKTYEECCDILELSYTSCCVGYEEDLLDDFQKLLICRDAYWKLAGDWKPDWKDGNTKYIITFSQNKVYKDVSFIFNYILAFPTEEMLDAFYENFKNLIVQCKELL